MLGCFVIFNLDMQLRARPASLFSGDFVCTNTVTRALSPPRRWPRCTFHTGDDADTSPSRSYGKATPLVFPIVH